MNESPPVLMGETVFWLGSGSGLPKRGKVKWLGKLAEMGPGWAIGVELAEELPYGGIDGSWGHRKLFHCKHKHGLIVPASSLISERRYLHSVKEEGLQLSKGSERKEEPKGSYPTHSKKSSTVPENKNALVPVRSNLERGNVRLAGRRGERIPREYLTQPRCDSGSPVLCSWMVDHQRHNERLFFDRMDIRRREINRSLDEGLVFESPRNSFHSSRSSGSRNRSSGIFALFKWFKKERSGEESDLEVCSDPASPVLPRNTSITGSVDTLFSTATAHSFAYVPPLQYRPFGSADPPEIRIAVGPETNTYRNRIRERERLRYLEKNISLREKYRLYASGTLPRSVDHIHELRDEQLLDLRKSFEFPSGSKNSTLGRLKRRAPPPPQVSADISADNKLEEELGAVGGETSGVKQHRRTLSEPTKFVKVCHVKGKRKAPPPPGPNYDPDIVSLSTTNSNSSKRSRKKRRAPSPPIKKDEHSKNSGIVNIIREATYGILNDELGAYKSDELKEETASTASTVDIGSADVVCTDTLKLERGILKPKMEKGYMDTKVTPSSPVSPRPWYKRAANRDVGSMKDKDKKKDRDRRKVEDWMLESGFPRRSLLNHDNKCNIFSRTDKTDDKRKSQISILTNISELDREAAEIIRRGKERERNLIETHNAMYYSNNNEANDVNEPPLEPVESPRKNSAKELISLFNAITNVTKVTVNSSFFSKDSSALFNRDVKEKSGKPTPDKYIKSEYDEASTSRAVEIESFDEVVHRRIPDDAEKEQANDDKPGSSGSSSNGRIARVTIEELDEYDAERNSKVQVLYEAHKQNRQLSPPIPTITEVSEGSAKSSPTSSTVSDLPTEPLQDVIVVSVKKLNVWICPRCTLENLRWRLTCEACEMWRPNPYEMREQAIKEYKSPDSSAVNSNQVAPSSSSLYPNLSNVKSNSEITSKSNVIQKEKNNEGNKSGELKTSLSNGIASEKKEDRKISKEKREKSVSPENDGQVVNNVANFRKPIDKAVVLDKVLSALEEKNNNKTSPEGKATANVLLNKENTGLEIKKTNGASPIEGKEKTTKEAGDASSVNDEEVRKARLAFFKKCNQEDSNTLNVDRKEDGAYKNSVLSSVSNQNKDVLIGKKNESKAAINDNYQNKSIKSETQASAEPQQRQTPKLVIDDDKQKLKEMLIEMKHSLPKRPKPFKKSDGENSASSGIPDSKIIPSTSLKSNILPMSSAEQVKISSDQKPSTSSVNFTPKSILRMPSDEKAEAYLIESETIVEEIKLKKPSEKVSSSVQTSGLVRQISPKIRPSSGKEIFIPIKVEENKIKDGILYTSVSNETRKLGTGTFELLRPRDFACIKDVKTENSNGPLPVYANMVDDDASMSIKCEEASSNSSAYIDKLSKQLVNPQGVANFRARFDLGNDTNANTLAVNRLLKRLENAIAGGNHEQAAALARELAQMKVNCSVVRQKPQSPTNEILLNLYVEDKVSHQGPFPLKVKCRITVGDLKGEVEREYEIPVGVQRWILGKQLANDDSATLDSLGVTQDGSPVFLYLVAPELNPVKTEDALEVEIKPSTSGIRNTVEIEEIVDEPEIEVTPEPVESPKVKFIIKEESPVSAPSGASFTIIKQTSAPSETNKPPPSPTGTLKLGWKCEVCTLLNSPTRPGCVACSAGRPATYQVPVEYKPSTLELERIKKENQYDQQSAKAVEEEKVKNYQQLVDLEKDDVIIYMEAFECPICLGEFQPTEGVVLRECLHAFCRSCLADTIHFSEEAEVKCPFRDAKYTCDSILLEREIKALVTPQAYEEHLAKSIALAETKISNAFHCKTPDCKGWCIYEEDVNIFRCPVCTHTNCLTCQAIHEGLNCKQYQEQLNNTDMNVESKRTKEMLQEMVDRGEAMNCPTCQVVLMKKWGCDWLRCSMCKTEICWITRGPRWGPNGKGDTTGGCQCGVNGIKCHPKCTYCH